jgi:hypothetical protein
MKTDQGIDGTSPLPVRRLRDRTRTRQLRQRHTLTPLISNVFYTLTVPGRGSQFVGDVIDLVERPEELLVVSAEWRGACTLRIGFGLSPSCSHSV